MTDLLTYNEVEALPEAEREAYRKRVADAVALLAKYEPITASFDVLEQGGCWGLKLKVRTYIGNHITYTSNPDAAPTRAELKRRQAEAAAAHAAKLREGEQ